jgi:hypothetical protein
MYAITGVGSGTLNLGAGCGGAGVDNPPGGAATDPLFAYVTALLHFDGNLTDVKGTTWTANGNAAATGDPKFGTKSLLLDGTGDYLRAGTASIAEFGTNDWTVEMWVYADDISVNGENWFDTRAANVAAAYVLGVTAAGALKVYDGVAERSSSGVFAAGQWNHVAYGVASNRLYMHLNGTKVYDAATAVTFTGAAAPALVWPFGGTQDLAGRIDEVRITKGVCRYTADFAVPTAAFPDS